MEQTITVGSKTLKVYGTDAANPIAPPDLSEGSEIQPNIAYSAYDLKYVVDAYDLADGRRLFVDRSLGYVDGVSAAVDESLVAYLSGWDCPEAEDHDEWLRAWGIYV